MKNVTEIKLTDQEHRFLRRFDVAVYEAAALDLRTLLERAPGRPDTAALDVGHELDLGDVEKFDK